MKHEPSAENVLGLAFLGQLTRLIQYRGAPPKAPSEYTFLVDALEQTGKALLGEQWCGDEMDATRWPVRPTVEVDDAYTNAVRSARWEIDWQTGVLGLVGMHNANVWGEATREALQREECWAENNAATGRLREAAEKMAQWFIDGKVKTASRGKVGGFDLRDIRPEEWMRDDIFETTFCTGTLNRWFPVGPKDEWLDVFVFVNRDQFDLALVAAGKNRAETLDGLHLSYDMQLAVALAREIKPGSARRDTVDSLQVRVSDLARTRGRPIADRRAKEIARLVYDPELKKGAR